MRVAAALLLAVSVALAAVGSVGSARADEVYTFVIRKQEEKAKSRWSLEDWLATRDRMRLMDLWLALHSSVPYEFWMKGDIRLSDSRAEQYPGGGRFSAAAYTSIFGIEIEKAWEGQSPFTALFDLRFFGLHVQNTNLTAQIGLLDAQGTRHLAYGLASTIYLLRQLGVDGYYRWFEDSGDRFEVGPFLDFGFLRLFGKVFGETAADGTYQSGTEAGAQIFF